MRVEFDSGSEDSFSYKDLLSAWIWSRRGSVDPALFLRAGAFK